MNLFQFKQRASSRWVTPSSPILFPFCGEFEPHPQPEDKIAHEEQLRQLTPNDCNGLSIEDSQALHEFKNMDQLHKADKVAATADRANKLRARLKKDGTAKFPENYKKH